MTDPVRQHLQSLEFDVPADLEPHPIPDSELPDDDGIDHDAPSTEFDLDFDFSPFPLQNHARPIRLR